MTDSLDDGLNRKLAALVRHSRRYIWILLAGMAVGLVALTAAVVYLLTVTSSGTSQNTQQILAIQQMADHRWCATLRLLTSVPVQAPADPKANPSRQASYLLYQDFVELQKQFHCE